MTVTIDVDVKQARRMLTIACGNQTEANKVEQLTEEEVVVEALKHCSGWGIKKGE